MLLLLILPMTRADLQWTRGDCSRDSADFVECLPDALRSFAPTGREAVDKPLRYQLWETVQQCGLPAGDLALQLFPHAAEEAAGAEAAGVLDVFFLNVLVSVVPIVILSAAMLFFARWPWTKLVDQEGCWGCGRWVTTLFHMNTALFALAAVAATAWRLCSEVHAYHELVSAKDLSTTCNWAFYLKGAMWQGPERLGGVLQTLAMLLFCSLDLAVFVGASCWLGCLGVGGTCCTFVNTLKTLCCCTLWKYCCLYGCCTHICMPFVLGVFVLCFLPLAIYMALVVGPSLALYLFVASLAAFVLILVVRALHCDYCQKEPEDYWGTWKDRLLPEILNPGPVCGADRAGVPKVTEWSMPLHVVACPLTLFMLMYALSLWAAGTQLVHASLIADGKDLSWSSDMFSQDGAAGVEGLWAYFYYLWFVVAGGITAFGRHAFVTAPGKLLDGTLPLLDMDPLDAFQAGAEFWSFARAVLALRFVAAASHTIADWLRVHGRIQDLYAPMGKRGVRSEGLIDLGGELEATEDEEAESSD